MRSRIRFILTRRSPRDGPAPRITGSGAEKSDVFWDAIGALGTGAAWNKGDFNFVILDRAG